MKARIILFLFFTIKNLFKQIGLSSAVNLTKHLLLSLSLWRNKLECFELTKIHLLAEIILVCITAKFNTRL